MLLPSVVSAFSIAVSGNCHTVLVVVLVWVAISYMMVALATCKCALEIVNWIVHIGCGSDKLSGVDHWSVVMLSKILNFK